ncbi:MULTISPECIES: hypothetical protein [unclassified Crossiella]|uniref:hypothetical protein n=1 Tax=unclassified Crossiella TaxID=2620835 RepID=UPI001FFF0DAB|nr:MULTISPECIES: hypothetical protein [unclassified Crossiella]MCK2244233.1 hypothetical protein [Crossiella sp. S99.2]MCK2258037.1 hypothetical protein [Crossiella sp. S99.1]
MSTKPATPGGGAENGSAPSSPAGGGNPVDLGGGGENIRFDTDALAGAAENFRHLGVAFAQFAGQFGELLSHPPLVNGETDETWDKFQGGYAKGVNSVISVLYSIGTAVGTTGESMGALGKLAAAAEEQSEAVAVDLRRNMPTGKKSG